MHPRRESLSRRYSSLLETLQKPSRGWYARNAVGVRMQEASDGKERENFCRNTFPLEKTVVLGPAGTLWRERGLHTLGSAPGKPCRNLVGSCRGSAAGLEG